MKWILSLALLVCLAGGVFAGSTQEEQPSVTLKLYMPPPAADLSDKDVVLAEVNRMLKPKIGAAIDITFVDWGNYAARINTMLAANEPFDWYNSVGLFNFSDAIGRGMLFPLDDLLAKYGKTILKMTPREWWPAVTYQGHKMAIINVYPYAQWKGVDFSQELVEKYKFDYLKVKTLKDIEPFLAQIKANER